MRKLLFLIAFAAGLLAGFGEQSTSPVSTRDPTVDASAEFFALKAKIAQLEMENARLRATAAALLAQVDAGGEDLELVHKAAMALQQRYPSSPEADVAAQRIKRLVALRDQQAAQTQRLAQLGLKALALHPRVAGDDATPTFAVPSLTRRCIRDSYSDHFRYRDAEKGVTMVVVKIAATSSEKNPRLPESPCTEALAMA